MRAEMCAAERFDHHECAATTCGAPGVFANDGGAYDHLRVCSAEIGAKTLRRLHAVGVEEALNGGARSEYTSRDGEHGMARCGILYACNQSVGLWQVLQ